MAAPELNLSDYLRIIRKRKWTIVLITVICAGSAWYYISQQPPIYRSSVKIMIEEPRSITTGSVERYYPYADFITTQSHLILTGKVAEDAAEILGWINPNTPPKQREAIIKKIQGSISTEKEGLTRLVDIFVTTDNARESAMIANAVAKGFQQFSLNERTAQASAVRAFVGKQLEEVEARLHKKEEALKTFRENSERSGSIAAMRSQLVTWEAQLDSLLERYTGRHPDVKEKRRQLAGLRARLGKYPELEMKLNQIQRDIKTDRDLYGVLKHRYEDSRIKEAENISGVTVVSWATLPRGPVSSKKMINTVLGGTLGLFLGLVLAFVRENLDTSIGTIEEIEAFLKLPVLGVIPEIIPEGENAKKFSLFNFLQQSSNERMRPEDSQRLLNLTTDSHSTASEAYKTLRTNLNFVCDQKKLKVIVFTSSGSQEGKTVTVTNCALAFAQSGHKVLLVSADLRRGTIHKMLGIKKEPGLVDILTKGMAPDQTIQRFTDLLLGNIPAERLLKTAGIDNLSILSEGRTPTNPAELLGSDGMSELLTQMREKYDYIFIDCPPVLPVADALSLSPKSDGVVIVYQVGKTARGALKRTKVQLAAIESNVIGVILNNIKAAELKMGPSYYYYYGYGYGYHTDEKKKRRRPWYIPSWLYSGRKDKNRDVDIPPPGTV